MAQKIQRVIELDNLIANETNDSKRNDLIGEWITLTMEVEKYGTYDEIADMYGIALA